MMDFLAELLAIISAIQLKQRSVSQVAIKLVKASHFRRFNPFDWLAEV